MSIIDNIEEVASAVMDSLKGESCEHLRTKAVRTDGPNYETRCRDGKVHVIEKYTKQPWCEDCGSIVEEHYLLSDIVASKSWDIESIDWSEGDSEWISQHPNEDTGEW